MKMIKQYRELEFYGDTLEYVVNKLQEYNKDGKLIATEFNGTMLYSDTVDMNEAYLKITGKTKKEFDDMIENKRLEREKKRLEHEENIPKLTQYWIEKGKQVLNEDKLELWNEIVPIRLKDLYQGMELRACLEIIEILNKDNSFEEAKNKLKSQNHSGMSHSLVCAMIKEFSECGEEFLKYIK